MKGPMNRAGAWRAIWAFAGSKNFSVFVMVMGIADAFVLAIFGFLVEDRWLDIMAGLYPFRLLYGLFFLNLIALGIWWVPAVVRRCRLPELPERVEHPGRFDHAIQIRNPGFRTEELKKYLRWRGYRIRIATGVSALRSAAGRPETLVHASKGRYSLVGNLLFHAGFLLLLCGAVTNTLYRFEGSAVIAEGAAFSGAKGEYRRIAESSVVKLPDVDFDVGKITAEFWEGRLLFTRLEAQITHRDGRDVARLSNAVRVGQADLTISGFGYAPLVVLQDRSGREVTRARVRLNIFPPGSEDYFSLPGYPHKVFVSFFPDYANVNGRIVNRSMDPLNPAYFLRILRGRLIVYSGVVRPGEWAEYDGLRISFPSFVRSGTFKIVRNPGHPLIWIAFVVMVSGLAWRLLFYRQEVVLWRDEAGRTWLSGRFDYFRRLHAGWLAGLAVDFAGVAE